MNTTLMLANEAIVVGDGLLDLYGLGWTVTRVPTESAALVAIVVVPWHETDRTHTFAFYLVDEDGRDVRLWRSPSGDPTCLNSQGEFRVERPSAAPPGIDIEQQITVELAAGMQLKRNRGYQWRMRINDSDVATRSFFTRSEADS